MRTDDTYFLKEKKLNSILARKGFYFFFDQMTRSYFNIIAIVNLDIVMSLLVSYLTVFLIEHVQMRCGAVSRFVTNSQT